VPEMKPLGLGRGHTGQYSRPRRWRRDAGADDTPPLLALGSDKGFRTERGGVSVSEMDQMKPLGLGRGHTGQYSRPRRWRRGADHGGRTGAPSAERGKGRPTGPFTTSYYVLRPGSIAAQWTVQTVCPEPRGHIPYTIYHIPFSYFFRLVISEAGPTQGALLFLLLSHQQAPSGPALQDSATGALYRAPGEDISLLFVVDVL
jgi:hypothetical protein